MSYHYIKLSVPGITELAKALDPELYDNLGTTLDDYRADKWVPLNDEQVAFATANPGATIAEIWSCQLTPAPVRTIEHAKAEKCRAIDRYDQSDAVNSFTLMGAQVWLDKATRVGLANSISIEEQAGRVNTVLWFGGIRYELPIAAAKQMLAALELYALECYNVTAQHRHIVSQFETVEEIDAYDYKVGYPEKLNLNAPE